MIEKKKHEYKTKTQREKKETIRCTRSSIRVDFFARVGNPAAAAGTRKSEDVACMFRVGVQHHGRPEPDIFFSDLVQRHSIITFHNSDIAFPCPKPCLSTAY